MKNTSYERLTAGLIAAWFVFAFSAGALHVFQTDPKPPAAGAWFGRVDPDRRVSILVCDIEEDFENSPCL